ncbi:ribonuclease H1 large subunit [Perkinsela sp. CCAP 1560/4]|nr:ribonuclease H1 large subunit [Perkinsela sp. CCAP 1560/4]|eukprot:KNH07103.1 ribonuclease H1 large subunit [Perkinsela sp. CCAP 1560/4]
MVYAAFGVYREDVPALKDTGVNDSKALSPTSREAIFARITKHPLFYHEVDVIEPHEISRIMSSERAGVNLNSLSHNAAAGLIQRFLTKSLAIKTVYLDTVGDATKYQEKLQKLFPAIQIVVSTKADSKYVSVGAASIVAKVTRDRLITDIERTYGASIGCGYPSDPITVRFLKGIIHPLYGFSENHVRLRWKTCENLIDSSKNMVEIKFDKKEQKQAPKKFFRKRDRSKAY